VGPVQAHHAGPRAFGQKAPDVTAVALCLGCHAALHDVRGFFHIMGKTERREWLDEQIGITQALYLERDGKL
jgi:hypothetical protein